MPIEIRHGAAGPRAALLGEGLDVWEVIETLRLVGNRVGRAAGYLGISEPSVREALAYRELHPGEIDGHLRDEQRRAVRAREGREP